MTAFELLQDFRSRGVLLEVQNGKLRFAPKGAVTPELRAALKEHKDDLLVLLAEKSGEPKTAIGEPAEPAEPGNDVRRRTSFTALAVAFLTAVESLLVTVKDERPAVLRTPQLKRDLKATENALSKYRAVLLPEDLESRAVGESLADRYRGLN